MSTDPFLHPPPAVRLLCAAAALVSTSALVALLLATWHQAAAPLWLAATPDVLADVAACDNLAERTQRLRCKRGVVAARAPGELRPFPVAVR